MSVDIQVIWLIHFIFAIGEVKCLGNIYTAAAS